MSPTPQQLRQWSEEVAADPGSPAFLPLARHYREAGRHDAALRLVLRGLDGTRTTWRRTTSWASST